ncbi:hypothetical protein B566_EDAN016924 [Ephemera danica]|nr:hypothetical protein B566_EDAN016924 [Ephemera danica]
MLGGLIQPENEELAWALRAAVDHVNRDRTILPQYTLVAQPEKVPERDSFLTCTKDEGGLVRISELLKMYDPKGYPITVLKRLPEVLKQAQQVGLMASHHSYIITSLDMHTIDLEPYQYSGTNITGFRLVDPSDPDVRTAVDMALMYDAVLLFAKALRRYHQSHRITTRPLNCETEENWEHGFSLINFMKVRPIDHRGEMLQSNEMKGATGLTRFDNEGFRSQVALDIVELSMDGLTSVGSWNSSEGSDPYGMLREASEKLTGNERYEGFGIELIQDISNMLGFNYTFHVQADGNYGSKNKDGEWNGMIKELREYRADLAITDLTITSERESAVDFTMPFMNLGISILYRKPSKQAPSLFSFMSPFSNEVWIYMFITYIGVSVLLFGLASPYEWTNPYPCIEDPDHLENQFSLKNSLWFTIGSLMQQGSDIAPTAVSTRMVAGIWWFFTLIMVSSYTANLAAFLTIESLVSPIKSLEDLANQNGSNNTLHQRIWQFMETHPHVFTTSNQEGIDRVKKSNGKYAFFMESSSIEYVTERECGLAGVGGLLDAKGYGIAMRKNTNYRNAISAAVLKLQEVGKMYALKVKWWKEKRGGGQCKDDTAGSGAASELGLANVGGVFVVLIVGVAFACVIAMLELCWSVARNTRELKIPFWPEIGAEVKFALKCKGSTKPVRQRVVQADEEEDEGGMENFVPVSPYAVPPQVQRAKDAVN